MPGVFVGRCPRGKRECAGRRQADSSIGCHDTWRDPPGQADRVEIGSPVDVARRVFRRERRALPPCRLRLRRRMAWAAERCCGALARECSHARFPAGVASMRWSAMLRSSTQRPSTQWFLMQWFLMRAPSVRRAASTREIAIALTVEIEAAASAESESARRSARAVPIVQIAAPIPALPAPAPPMLAAMRMRVMPANGSVPQRPARTRRCQAVATQPQS